MTDFDTDIRSDSKQRQSLRARVRDALNRCRSELLAERVQGDHWEGELAASALSTATAISAMSAVLQADSSTSVQAPADLTERIHAGIQYLRTQQNDDGGFGDTDRSHSNIATSYLVLAASTLAERATGESLSDASRDRLRGYIAEMRGVQGLRERYGTDKTFVVPILCNLAIAGLVDWDDVQALPFEAAAFPQSMYRFLRMPVVSYAVPALVAIGQARHFLGRRAIAPLRLIRRSVVDRTLKVLGRMQPQSGGYLEATPLTAFVVMSLAATGRTELEVVKNGLRFLCDSMRDDGGWPIDTNLATWVTSLSVHALACDPEDDGGWCTNDLVDWHLGCQHRTRHPFTGADPGGWGWTDLSGAVPDGDDTPGAMLALKQFERWCTDDRRSQIRTGFKEGKKWISDLQNRDGGWPTFCRGWGKLPFDRSSTDLSAHAIRALGTEITTKQRRSVAKFLNKNQQPDGSWFPLWFGNQDRSDEAGPIYGTSRVLMSDGLTVESIQRATKFLIKSQNPDGGWGGGESLRAKLSSCLGMDGLPQDLVSSIEETALVVEALSTIVLKQRDFEGGSSVQSEALSRETRGPAETLPAGVNEDLREAIICGVEFLLTSIDQDRHRVAWPIGFYFAKLWYHERLYPLVFTVAALGKFLRATSAEHDRDWPK